MQRSFCFAYMQIVYSYGCTRSSVYMLQRGVFVSLFILLMVFGDTSDMMSMTSLYAFLVSINEVNYADFGRLISTFLSLSK